MRVTHLWSNVFRKNSKQEVVKKKDYYNIIFEEWSSQKQFFQFNTIPSVL